MAEAAVVNKTDDTEAMRIALENDVKAAEKELERRRSAALASAKPVIQEFSGFLNKQNGVQVGMFNIRGENLRSVGPNVTLNGLTAKVTGLRDNCIKGLVPQDLTAGVVKVKAGDVIFDGTIA